MKPKLTAGQKRRARLAVAYEINVTSRWSYAGRAFGGLVKPTDPEWPEVKRLLRMALAAVRKAGRR